VLGWVPSLNTVFANHPVGRCCATTQSSCRRAACLLELGQGRFREPEAAAFLVAHMQPDGTWERHVEYFGIPHAYSRVSWALLRWAHETGDEAAAPTKPWSTWPVLKTIERRGRETRRPA